MSIAPDTTAELPSALDRLTEVDVRVVLTHYRPQESTLVGERPQVWPFLGCGLLGKAIDADGRLRWPCTATPTTDASGAPPTAGCRSATLPTQ